MDRQDRKNKEDKGAWELLVSMTDDHNRADRLVALKRMYDQIKEGRVPLVVLSLFYSIRTKALRTSKEERRGLIKEQARVLRENDVAVELWF